MANKSKPTNDREPKVSEFNKPRRNDKDNKKKGNRGKNAKKATEQDPRLDGQGGSNLPSTESNSWNDPIWYFRYPEIVLAASKVPFPYKPGMSVPGPTYTSWSGVTKESSVDLPGILSINFDYTIGTSYDNASPASIASDQFYYKIRKFYSGKLECDAPDIFMYAYGLSQIFAYIAYLKRIYRVIGRWSPQNTYMPRELLKSLFGKDYNQVNFNSFLEGKMELWNYINTLVRMLSQYNVPGYMDLFKRAEFVCNHVFCDNPSEMSHFYVFVPNGWYVITEMETNPGVYYTELEYKTIRSMPFYQGEFNPKLLFDFGLYLVTSFNNWHDALKINGYIMRAYQGTPMYGTTLIGLEEDLVPVYQTEVLNQIHNLTVMSQYVPDNITQNPVTGAIIHNPSVPSKWNDRVLIDIPSFDPTPADVVLATRLSTTINPLDGSLVCGSEIVTGLTMLTTLGNMVPYWHEIPERLILPVDAGMLTDDWDFFVQNLRQLFELAYWQGFPRQFIQVIATEHGSEFGNSLAMHYGSISNMTSMPAAELAQLHRAVMYSLFDSFIKSTNGKGAFETGVG